MSYEKVKCSICCTSIPQREGSILLCEKYHVMCSKCMRLKNMMCPICNANVKPLVFTPTTSSLEENNITSCKYIDSTESFEMRPIRDIEKVEAKPKLRTVLLERDIEPSKVTNETSQQTASKFWGIDKTVNNKKQEVYVGDDSKRLQDILVVSNECAKLAEALQETSGTVQMKYDKAGSSRAHKPSTYHNNFEDSKQKLVKTYFYCCRPLIPQAITPDEPRMTPLCVPRSEYKRPHKTYISDAISHGLCMQMSHMPYFCPCEHCLAVVGSMDVFRHFMEDHAHLPKERIKVDQLKNFTLDSHHFAKKDKIAAAIMYALYDPTMQLDSQPRNDNYLPILVLARHADLGEILEEENPTFESQNYLLVWLAGVIPEKIDIQGSLLLVGDGQKGCGHRLVSSPVYSLRQPQDVHTVYKNGKPLMLESKLVAKLSDHGKEPLKFQVILK